MNRIKHLREERGWSQSKLAKLLDTTAATVQRLETGGRKGRKLTQDWINRFAVAFRVHPTEIISEPAARSSPGVPVMGEIRAGAWLEVAEPQHDQADEFLPVLRDRRYPEAQQYALKIVGNSMNKFAKSGTYVVVADWAETGRELTEGDVVVVRRERAMTYECTLKRVRKGAEGDWQLWPESDDPRHQEPVAMTDGRTDVEVRITGLVIGKFERV